MRALTVRPHQPGSAAVLDLPEPEPDPEQYLVEVLEVGICGTDRDIAAGEYGAPPAGSDHLVLGHESLGRVLARARDSASFAPGDLVVGTVRRACPEHCPPCRTGFPDFCATGHYRERGIQGLHGYCSERYVARPEHLVRVPAELRSVAVLLEPASIVEKALRQVRQLERRLPWKARRALITGAGPVGMLAAMLARLRGLETLVYSLVPDAGPRAHIYEQLGIQRADAAGPALADALHDFGPPDIHVEATGYSPLALEGAAQLAINGVAVLLSVTGGDRHTDVATDHLNLQLVLGNRLVFGSVSAHRLDFEQGVRDLAAIERQAPGLLGSFITGRVALADAPGALAGKAPEALKTIVELAH